MNVTHTPASYLGGEADRMDRPRLEEHVGEGSRGSGLSSERLRAAIDFMESHLSETLPVDAVAAEAHLSPSHFSRCFKRSTGLTPHQYLVRLRVARACQLLQENPQHSLASLALEAGFSHQSHLNRHFRRLLGTTPGRYARKERNCATKWRE